MVEKGEGGGRNQCGGRILASCGVEGRCPCGERESTEVRCTEGRLVWSERGENFNIRAWHCEK